MPEDVGAYFYPLTKDDPVREKRAKDMGLEIADETLLAQKAEPLFPGHEQPKTYSLGGAESTWDDAETAAMGKQIELARQFGLGFFVFDTYMGMRKEKFVEEANAPLDKAFLKLNEAQKMKFALMLSFKGPRAVLPVPPGFSEPGREFDFTPNSAKAIVDNCVKKYWSQPNYLHIDGKPYLSIFTSDITVQNGRSTKEVLRDFLGQMNDHARKKYKIDPYIAGIVKKSSPTQDIGSAAQEWEQTGFNGLTGYALLPEFGKGAPAIQVYSDLIAARREDWFKIAKSVAIPVVPPAVVGWDATSRGVFNLPQNEGPIDLDEYSGIYPHLPIVVGSTPELFETILRDTLSFVDKQVPPAERYGIICAWNEITEGTALLPTVSEGKLDYSYLDAVKRAIDANRVLNKKSSS